MTPNEYIEAARRFDTHIDHMQKMTAVWGLTAEAGEVANEFERAYRLAYPDSKMVEGLDTEKFKAELGDVLWHLSRLLDLHGWTFEELMDENIKKLTERYEREGIPNRDDR